MKEAVMISIKPKWCQLIASGKKLSLKRPPQSWCYVNEY